MCKRILFLLIGISFAASVQAQIIPNGFSFQAVARDASGNIAPNRVVYIQADVLKGVTNAVSVYSELHQVTTTAEGIFSIIVGEGSQPSTKFSNIVWSDDTYSLKVKIAVTPVNPPVNWTYQSAFIDAGTVQLLSVPYAKVAGNGVDTSKIFFLRDTTKILGNYFNVNRNIATLLKEKLNIADSITGYVTPAQLKNAGGGASGWYDTTQMLSGYMRRNNAVTSVSIDSANGIFGTVKNPYSTPVLSLSLKDIVPLSVTSASGSFNKLNADSVTASGLRGTLTTASQPNITSLGVLSSLSVSGVLSAGSLSGTLSPQVLSTITSLGNLSSITVTDNISTHSLNAATGNLINLSVPGTLTAANATINNLSGLSALTLTGTITANTISTSSGIIGNLSVPGSITGGSFNGTLNGTIIQANQPNITSVGQLSNLSVTGTVQANVLSASSFNVTQLGGLSNLSVANTVEATSLKGTITQSNQPNITSVGQLGNLSVTGTAEANVLSATTLNVSQLGGLSNLSVANTVEAASLKGTITQSNQPNITSIGQLGNLSVTGTAEANVLSATTLNVSQLGGLSNLSVVNTVEAASLKGTITQSNQPNITSIGQLGNLSVTGTGVATTFSATNASFTNISGLNLITGTVSDDVVTISNGVLRKKAAETFTADFVVNGTSFLKWADGETVPAAGKTAIQLLQEGAVKAIHPTYNNPSVSINATPSGGNVEIGSNITVTLGSTFTQNDAGAATTTTYRKNGTGIGSNTDNVTNITSAISYTVNVAYGQGACKNDNLGNQDCTGRINAGNITSSAITYTPMARRYWGYISSTSPSDANIIAALGGGTEFSNSKVKSSFTITPPGTANYIYFAYPASLGPLTSIMAGGFESFGAFTLTTRSFVNASGHSQSYHIYISNNTFSSAVTGITTL